ncbi:MAG: apolipoprotein N-acyltransferase [Armatimonadetes bacterium]|nr:apolipoprotein N-acyltransferase [Armatimonadota bacterium]
MEIPSTGPLLSLPFAITALIFSALALYYAQPGTGGTGGLAWMALVPLLAALQGCRPRAAFGRGYAWGLAYNLLILVWLRPFGPAPWLALSFIQALSPALFAMLASVALRRGGWAAVGGAAALWTLSEQLRSFISFGLSWGDLSLTQVGFPAALHTTSWWGAIGLSFLVALVNAAIWGGLSPSPRPPATPLPEGEGPNQKIGTFGSPLPELGEGPGVRAAIAYCLLPIAFALLALIFGFVGQGRKQRLLIDAPRVAKVGLVQANVGRTIMEGTYADPESAFRAYEAMTDDLARRGCKWIVWPESATPSEVWNRRERLSALARRNRIYLLAGGFDETGWDRIYNAVFCFGPDGHLLDTYHKRRIVPFGEFVPWRKYLPPLDRFGVPATDLTPGIGKGVLTAGPLQVGMMICFESLFPDLALAQRRAGADLLAVATNDSYYGRTPAAAFHAASLQLRAVETGLPAVQAASTGYSLVVLPDGRVEQQSELFEPAALAVTVPPPLPAPFWVRFPWLTWAVILALAILSLIALPQRKRV